MQCSLKWLNRYLEPGNVGPDEAEAVLMGLGFPIESRTEQGGDWLLDVEVTSNRGDCLSHLGLAREVAAKTGRKLRSPLLGLSEPAARPPAGFTLENKAPDACPRFTARVIRGVKVGPSPAWLREALEATGQRSISNVVDVTNFLCHETGNPCHVFDLAKLGGASLVVRVAHKGETLTTLDGKARTLAGDEIVVADATRAQSLAGVIGGADSEVGPGTTDIVLEVATWDPVAVRRASRRHQVRTDASHRFERLVDAGTLATASARAAAMIVEVAGGRVEGGLISAGPLLPERPQIRLRPAKVRSVLGQEVSKDEIAEALRSLGIGVSPLGRGGDDLLCDAPAYRTDLTREIDLVEEVARLRGLDAVPLRSTLSVSVQAPQAGERARRVLGSVLSGLGFFETVTFSFTTRPHAALFMGQGHASVEVDEQRRADDPALRPSVLPGLLASRRANRHAQVRVEGGVRFFEVASVFRGTGAGTHQEVRRLALLADIPGEGSRRTLEDRQQGVRLVRGAIEGVVRALGGAKASIRVQPGDPCCPAYANGAFGRVELNGVAVGEIGLLGPAVLSAFDLETPVVAAEIDLEPLLSLFPPGSRVQALAAFPAIERDLSVVLGEGVAWDDVSECVRGAGLDRLESLAFVGTYRGKQVGEGRKSLTMRLVFRDGARTLTREEADAPIARAVAALQKAFGAELRA